eukprot:65359_1
MIHATVLMIQLVFKVYPRMALETRFSKIGPSDIMNIVHINGRHNIFITKSHLKRNARDLKLVCCFRKNGVNHEIYSIQDPNHIIVISPFIQCDLRFVTVPADEATAILGAEQRNTLWNMYNNRNQGVKWNHPETANISDAIMDYVARYRSSDWLSFILSVSVYRK